MTDAEKLTKFKEALIEFTFRCRPELEQLRAQNKAIRKQLANADRAIASLLERLPNVEVIDADPTPPVQYENFWPKDLMGKLAELDKQEAR